MTVTLAALAEPTSPPTVATRNAIAAEEAKFEHLNPKQMKLITIVALTYAVQAGGDTDYRTNHAQLITDSQIAFAGTSIVDDYSASRSLIVLQAVMAWQLANDVGSISADVDTLLGLAKDIAPLDMETLNRATLWLQYMESV